MKTLNLVESFQKIESNAQGFHTHFSVNIYETHKEMIRLLSVLGHHVWGFLGLNVRMHHVSHVEHSQESDIPVAFSGTNSTLKHIQP
jgi:hypothetical protein